MGIQVDVEQIFGPPVIEERQFVFDIGLGPDVSQDVLYEQVGARILQNSLDGLNGTLFAYGQTGSGKSFSVMGPDNNPGVIPQLMGRLFEVVDDDPRETPADEMRITLSFLEIYNEEIKDLLDPRPRTKKLYVHQHPKMGIYVPHLTEAAVTHTAECMRLLDFGAKVRATAQTNMNSTSSRSHSVLTLRLTQVFPGGTLRNSSVNLCDLAGSERVKKTGATGQRAREGSCINNSLSVLGQVISKLAAGGGERKGVHVPFRQSKLTHLLQDALSGNSVTTMLANVSPAHSECDESLSTLRFAESVKKVKTKPVVEEMAPEDPEILLQSFSSEIEVLKQALVKEGNSAVAEQAARAIEASEQLMQSFASRSGTQWAKALEETSALEAVQRQLLQDMCLPMKEVGSLAGVESGTPYLLNISDDPALSGVLVYFLRKEPEVSTVGSTGPESIAPNSIMLRGLGIPARLCEIRYNPEGKVVTITKTCEDEDKGRILVNGQPLGSVGSVELHHADRIVFGWAFCFRLVASGMSPIPEGEEDFEKVSKEVLEYSLTTTCAEMGMIRAVSSWQADFSRRDVGSDDAERIMGLVGELMVGVEEANLLCREAREALPEILQVQFDVGICYAFMMLPKEPTIVVQVWKSGENRRLLTAWPAEDFNQRLVGLRDAHRAALSRDTQSSWAWKLAQEEWWRGEDAPGGVSWDEGSMIEESADCSAVLLQSMTG